MWFSSKKNIVAEGLLEGYVDIHSHILPGVDDGAKDQESTEKILASMQSMGVKKIFATPHVMSNLYENSTESLTEAFSSRLEPLSAKYNIELGLAAEYMIDRGFVDKLRDGEQLLTYNDNSILIEFSASGEPLDLENVLFEIEDCGYSIILAHPERYPYFNERAIRKLKSKDVMLQLNLLSLGGYYGETVAKTALNLLRKGYYDFVGSDVHSLRMVERIKNISIKKNELPMLRSLVTNNKKIKENNICVG